MKAKVFAAFSLMTLGLPLVASAADPACPEAAGKILSAYGLAKGVSQPNADTNLSNGKFLGIRSQRYENAQRKINIEVTERSGGRPEEGMSFVRVEFNTTLYDPAFTTAIIDQNAKTYLLAYDAQCRTVDLRADVQHGFNEPKRVLVGPQFCRNLKAGKSPRKSKGFGRPGHLETLDFDDHSGSIPADNLAETKEMCQELAPFLTATEEVRSASATASSSSGQSSSAAARAE